MYRIKVDSQAGVKPNIVRCIGADTFLEVFAEVVKLCKEKYSLANPVVLCLGHQIYIVFNLENPNENVEVSMTKL